MNSMVPFPENDPPHRSLVLPALLTVIVLVLAAALAAGPWVLVGAGCGLLTAAVTK